MTKLSRILMSGVAALVLAAGSASLVATDTFAQDGQGQQTQAGQGQGGEGQGGQGQGGPGDNVGGEEEEDSDRRGPQYGQPEEGEDRGGQPAWSGEGIPEVELGRLSVIRSPDQVLDRALAEALATFDAAMEDYYEMTAAEFAEAAATSWDSLVIYDSPLQNLALLQDLWEDGNTSLPGVEPASLIELSAIFIGVASDKTLPVTEDTVLALAIISGVEMSDSVIASIAAKAEEVRAAVLIGHG